MEPGCLREATGQDDLGGFSEPACLHRRDLRHAFLQPGHNQPYAAGDESHDEDPVVDVLAALPQERLAGIEQHLVGQSHDDERRHG